MARGLASLVLVAVVFMAASSRVGAEPNPDDPVTPNGQGGYGGLRHVPVLGWGC